MDCPACGLVNPPTAQRCDCGYDFVDRSQKQPLVPPSRSSKLSGWAKLGIIFIICGSVFLEQLRDKIAGGRGSDDIREAQQALKAEGFDPGPIDGRLGPQTKAALSEYQTTPAASATRSTSRSPSTFIAEHSISTHTEAGRAR